MKIAYLVVMTVALFLSGILLSKHYHAEDINETFLIMGQYQPKYIAYSDQDMLYECEKYNLIYDFEQGICKL